MKVVKQMQVVDKVIKHWLVIFIVEWLIIAVAYWITMFPPQEDLMAIDFNTLICSASNTIVEWRWSVQKSP